jgi:hypothetical protein
MNNTLKILQDLQGELEKLAERDQQPEPEITCERDLELLVTGQVAGYRLAAKLVAMTIRDGGYVPVSRRTSTRRNNHVTR